MLSYRRYGAKGTCGREGYQLGPDEEEMIHGDPKTEETDLCPHPILEE